MEVDRLVLGDPEQPRAQVVATAQLRIGPQGGDPGLLEAVVRLAGPGAGDAEAVHVSAVLVEESLKGRQVHDVGTAAGPRM